MTQEFASSASVAPCPTCGHYRDTPNHEYGCDAAQRLSIDTEGGEVLLPPGMTEADLLRGVLRQVLDSASPEIPS